MNSLIDLLRNPALYDHPTDEITVLETHISWVVLTGLFAYKIKKPVVFSFLDFSTLERRRRFCEEELRLNRRFAPNLYREVVPITAQNGDFALRGRGPVVEYAVKMCQFEQQNLLSHLAGTQRLSVSHIDAMTRVIAEFHDRTQVAGKTSPYGAPEGIMQRAADNFANIRPCLSAAGDREALEAVCRWSEQQGRRLQDDFKARKLDGHVRECHGDLHLGNMAVVDGRITPFDCIEFNADLRWIDVVNEAAFVFMDLCDRGYPGFAYRFLDGYLQWGGDYGGVTVLRFYLVYRALVRAKVAVLRLGQGEPGAGRQQRCWEEYRGYIRLGQRLAGEVRPLLLITHGVTGAGKSTGAARLVEALGAVRIRSDVERKRLFGYRSAEDSDSALRGGIYNTEADRLTYGRLEELAAVVLKAGYPVIIDAAFLRQADRERMRTLAIRHNAPFVILDYRAQEEVLRERILRRSIGGGDASEADLRVLEYQLGSGQDLNASERGDTIPVQSDRDVKDQELVERILRRCP